MPVQHPAALPTGLQEARELVRFLVDRGNGFRPRTLTVDDGTRLHANEGGHGPRTALLLHGFCGTHRQLLGVARGLQATHRVCLLDARGHGKSDPFAQRPTMAQLADDVAAVVAQCEGPVDAIGLSMGAQTLFEYVRRHGLGRLGRLVFIDQAPRLLPDADGWPHALFGGMSPAEVSAFLAEMEHSPRALGRAWLRGIWRTNEPLLHRLALTPALLAGLPGVRARTLTLAADMVQQDWRDVIPRIERPVLLCYGGRSMYPGAGRWMHANLPNAQLEWFGASGHGLAYSEPLRLRRRVAAFLA